MKKDTKKQGDISELKVAAFALEKGFNVLNPIGDRCRYDQIWDIGDGFTMLRIQIKSPHISNGAIDINCKSMSRIQGKHISHKYTKDEIDAIAVPYDDKCLLIPIDEISGRSMILRIEIPRKKQSNIKWVCDYEFDKKINQIIKSKHEYLLSQIG